MRGKVQYLEDGKKPLPAPLSFAHLYSTGEEAEGGREGGQEGGCCNGASIKLGGEEILDQERRKEEKEGREEERREKEANLSNPMV